MNWFVKFVWQPTATTQNRVGIFVGALIVSVGTAAVIWSRFHRG
jgi:hypothetical protein